MGRMLGACLFALQAGIVCAYMSRRAVKMAMSDSPPKYESALLELRHPKTSPQQGAALIANDAFIARAVRGMTPTGDLYVYVVGDAHTSSADIAQYIADVYSRVYEESILNSCIGVRCAVMGDVGGAGLKSRAQLRGLTLLDAVYSSDVTGVRSLAETRASVGMSVVAIEELEYQPIEEDVWYLDGDSTSLPQFKVVALGGTFDRMHNGHRSLLTLAASCCGDKLVVGITCAELLSSKKNASEIYAFVKREKDVKEFLSIVKPTLKVATVGLVDPFGPTVTDKDIEAIVVSSETIGGARKINQIRSEKSLRPLKILVLRRRDAVTLSSTYLRRATRTSIFSRVKQRVKGFFGYIFAR